MYRSFPLLYSSSLLRYGSWYDTCIILLGHSLHPPSSVPFTRLGLAGVHSPRLHLVSFCAQMLITWLKSSPLYSLASLSAAVKHQRTGCPSRAPEGQPRPLTYLPISTRFTRFSTTQCDTSQCHTALWIRVEKSLIFQRDIWTGAIILIV